MDAGDLEGSSTDLQEVGRRGNRKKTSGGDGRELDGGRLLAAVGVGGAKAYNMRFSLWPHSCRLDRGGEGATSVFRKHEAQGLECFVSHPAGVAELRSRLTKSNTLGLIRATSWRGGRGGVGVRRLVRSCKDAVGDSNANRQREEPLSGNPAGLLLLTLHDEIERKYFRTRCLQTRPHTEPPLPPPAPLFPTERAGGQVSARRQGRQASLEKPEHQEEGGGSRASEPLGRHVQGRSR